ncbi:2-succinyl-6-hydroxy-2, 4-cyclohexadiene-1-carboxylate synthase [Cupriavidus yeoncheonensis]|uniref:2-succinyl-6-hydroxy-2, 4-cyclohexadiene-1-carboxylate synthase n=1 Tax=Cupriavidus yeoncheonensis TaxID=1462994 RepID=A0A916IYZ6_9BURK|nr:alpha/beta hydrolase [Cupriavidus yeoncheonensis]CAG2155147.1 2-succinyl-6-hydroxy-2, 4-cyclohexadiene-1-carboxylate synthase [Cupriavidus yeoncheonensis]
MGDEKVVGAGSELGVQYQVWREGPKGLVALIHGFLDDRHTWQRFASAASLDGWTVVSMDYAKGVTSNALDAYATRVAGLIEKLREPRLPVVLVGHSMGGQVAELVAGVSRVDALALILPAPLRGYPLTADQMQAFQALARQKDPQVVGKGRAARTFEADPDAMQVLVASAVNTPVDESLVELEAWVQGHRLGAVPSRAYAPTLVITSDDKFFSPSFLQEAVCARFANVSTQHVAGAGHWPHVEKPQATADAVAAFIAEIRPNLSAPQVISASNLDRTAEEFEEWFFESYVDTWIAVCSGAAEPESMLQYWGAPLHAAAMVRTQWLMSESDVLAQIRATQAPLKASGYRTTKILDRRVTIYNQSAACVDALWSRKGAQDQELQRVATHFEVHRTDNGWRVVAMANTLTDAEQLAQVWPLR